MRFASLIGAFLIGGVAVASVVFTDVTEEAGIRFRHENGQSGRRYFVEPLGSGVAVLDYDGDGFPDLYFVNGANLPGSEIVPAPRNALYRNNGDGTFTDVTDAAGVGDPGYGMGAVAGDFDNDGDPDLYVTNFGRNVLYRNNGDGTFTDVTDAAGVGDPRYSASAAFFDIENDGDLDLVVTNYVRYALEEDKPCETNGIRSYCDPRLYEGERDTLYRNNGDGTFTDVTEEAGLGNATGRGLALATGDYDDDGDLDLYVANDADRNFLFRNEGDGTFTEIGLMLGVGYSEDGEAENGMGADFGDFDNDGRIDLVVTNFQGQTNTLYRNEEGGYFLDVSYASRTGAVSFPYLAWGVLFFDFDGDADLDLFVANGHLHDTIVLTDPFGEYAQRNLLYRNDGDGLFTEIGTESGDGLAIVKVSRGSAYLDFDNDGDLDLVVTNLRDRPDLLRNDGGNANGWLALRLIGTESNRDAIGARVRVMTEAGTQVREVRSGFSYLSQSDLRLVFGLGGATVARRIEIRWPSGRVETFEEVPANRFLTLVEGEGFDRP